MEEYLNKEFFEWVDCVAGILKDAEKQATIVYHNDADGICSSAILSRVCEYFGLKTELICIEKVNPDIIEIIHADRDGIIIYTDLAGLAAEAIDRINAGRGKVIIIDHHPAKEIESDSVFVLNPELSGISGDIFVSASTLNYIFFRAIAGDEAEKCAYLAVVGSVGDYHDRYGGVLGFDRFALNEAMRMKQVKIMIDGMKERYYIDFFGEYADVVAERLTTLGAVGYEEKGYQLGLKACFEGFNGATMEIVKRLERIREEKFEKMVEFLKTNLKQEKHVQWFHIGDSFSPMGVKVVGEFCELIKDMTFVDDSKYLIGFQSMPKVVPDLGEIDWNVVKMSGRVPTPLERKIFKGEAPGLDYLVPKASEIVGAFADATHKIAAATIVDGGKEEEFIEAFERLVENEVSGG
ncbi:hypothetical protein Asulf_00393 [Archaeoglobus sulfaticallidus PM70-1]|uniref:DDH domain-containing protein n=1 Tax=Archaeoglobus sulfaticallidus PM70-1 TaxID=387631 RepID=N0BJV7_9EURY|nr:DHH family phosphoesterase [Archaeoglobus sulfaticallidus]AGK60420.1 hypothetical protein Asulf_00393 [Archaeoglobus sulfaticallidus PM70-1]